MESKKVPTTERSDPHLLVLHLAVFLMADEPPVAGKFEHLSRRFTGDILAVVNRPYFVRKTLWRFQLLGLFLPTRLRYMNLLRNSLFSLYATTLACYRHYTKRRYDIVIANNPLSGAIVGFLICALTGAKLVIEVNGNFNAAFKLDKEQMDERASVRHRTARILIPFMLRRADAVKLLYPGQVDAFARAAGLNDTFIFPNFVPTTLFQPSSSPERYVLFLGYPWYLKGVDVLIRAFQEVSPEFPDCTLKVVGHCPDRVPFERLAAGNPRIELMPAVWYQGVIPLLQECAIFVLPSRTDALPRVVREAMACRKPVIASRVDGIPSMIEHGKTGLLFESENVTDLAAQLRRVLGDPGFANQLAENAYQHARSHFSEERYVENYRALADRVLAGARA